MKLRTWLHVAAHVAAVLVTGRWGQVARAVDKALSEEETHTMHAGDPGDPPPVETPPAAPHTPPAPNVPDEPSEGG